MESSAIIFRIPSHAHQAKGSATQLLLAQKNFSHESSKNHLIGAEQYWRKLDPCNRGSSCIDKGTQRRREIRSPTLKFLATQSSAVACETMNGGYEVVDAGHHGGGKEAIKTEWKTIRTTFHNFASLPAERGKVVSSPGLECHGLKWRLEVYPGEHSVSIQREACVSFFLRCDSSKEKVQEVKAAYVIRAPTTGYQAGTRLAGSDGAVTFGISTPQWGIVDNVHRAFLLNMFNRFLIGGSLAIEADVQVVFDAFPWAPPTVATSNAACSECVVRRDSDADEVARLKEKYRKLEKAYKKRDQAYKFTKAHLAERTEVLKSMRLQLNPLSLDMLQLLESGASGDKADVTFETGNGDGKEKRPSMSTASSYRLVVLLLRSYLKIMIPKCQFLLKMSIPICFECYFVSSTAESSQTRKSARRMPSPSFALPIDLVALGSKYLPRLSWLPPISVQIALRS